MSKISKSDERLLDERISANQVEYPQTVLRAVGFVTAFLPVYFAHAVLSLEWTAISNLPLVLGVPIVSAEMLSRAYGISLESEFWRRHTHYSESKSIDDKLLRNLRLQAATSHALFFINLLFLAVSTLLQVYIFRNVDARAGLLLASCLSAAFSWMLAQSNEESRKRRLRVGRK